MVDHQDVRQHGPGLQWGHGREAMDGALETADHAQIAVLQWGHGREAMDGPARRTHAPHAHASMGPWP